ncbi:transmembrane protein 53 [Trichogramma pretiosum]|uniref:transmembrane protein 53 n=1 Tax=Trichogramma pretiosum TaxID=7493 RepID=UPI0006C97796|nr:transmembrane protein 53 [Trichogramma pretiosum]
MSERRLSDELEYHITFPGSATPDKTKSSSGTTKTTTTTTSIVNEQQQQQNQQEQQTQGAQAQQQQQTSKIVNADDFVFVYEEQKRPLVVLLGWAGCQDKYLAKYSAIYEERSCITLRCTAPVEYLFWRRDRLPHISRQLIQVIADKCTTDHPVFFHVFSNGGAIFYQHISYAMQQAGSPLKVKGVIFDSSPGERRITSLYRAISAIVGGHPVTNLPISLVITFFLSFIWLFEIIAHAISKRGTVKTDPSDLAEETYSWPQIFLYSNTDTLIRASDVERFATRRAERGVRTQLVLFTDSPHVKHFATYRDVYISSVCNFINECLATAVMGPCCHPGNKKKTTAAGASSDSSNSGVKKRKDSAENEDQSRREDDDEDEEDEEEDSQDVNESGSSVAKSLMHCLTKRIVLPSEVSSR